MRSNLGCEKTKIGDVPEEWEVARLGKVVDVYGGATPSTSNPEYWNGDIPFVTPTDVTGLEGRNTLQNTEKSITKKGLEAISAKLLPKGTVLTTTRASIGFCCISGIPVVTNQGLANLVCRDNIRNLYLLYQMRYSRKELERLADGSTYKEVSKKSLKRMPIPIPPIPEQQKIASILSTVDDAIQKTDEIVVKSRHLKMGLMRQLLTKGIGHTKFKKTEIGEMPDEWEAAELGEIGRTVTGRTPPTEVSEYYGGPYMFISPADIGEEKFVRESQKWLSKRGLDVSRPVGRNTILVVCIGATIGKTAMTQAESSATNQQINAVVPKDDVDPHYLYYAISHRSPRLAIQAGHAAVPIVNKGFFEQFLVPIPPISEQQKIAAVLSIVDADIDEETKRKTHLRELKKGLMQVLLTGKVRVKVT